ncbi:MAG TPA: hypothetical protein VFQ59_00205 [Candidatus Paceibacterota bacterium]|nr:hypothetical protein [Candidatus Paceibacterota bacterium]
MSKKSITILLVLVLVAILVYVFTMNRNSADISQIPEPVLLLEEREIRGTVLSVNNDEVILDGPSVITIRAEDGSEALIAIPSMGINLCSAKENIASPYDLKEGDVVEVRGEVGYENAIVPCQSTLHYLRVAQ